MERSGAFDILPKKEVLKLRHEKEKLERNMGGIQDMERRPDAVFVIDTKKEHIAVTEARKLGIPIIAIVDTNCDPDEVDHVIPGNDDAIRAIGFITSVIADAVEDGRGLGAKRLIDDVSGEDEFEAETMAKTTVFEPDAPGPVPAQPTGAQVFEPDPPAAQVFEPEPTAPAQPAAPPAENAPDTTATEPAREGS